MRKGRNTKHDVFKYVDMRGGNKTECWPWKGARNDKGIGYFQVNGVKHVCYRLVYELVHGGLNKTDVVRHKCDNGALGDCCCNPEHLEKGTHNDNMKDMRDRQRHGLPHHTVRAIRKLIVQGRTHSAIAELYGIARQTVTDIANKVTYREVDDG